MMSNEWDSHAEDWDTNSSAADYADQAFDELTTTINLDGLNVFDFGCGTGLLTERMTQHACEIVALDSSTKMIAKLERKTLPDVSTIAEFLSTDLIKENNLLGAKFDLVTASSVCAFLPDYEATAVLLKSLLKPNGIFVQWDWLTSTEGSGMGFSEQKVRHTLHQTGFINVTISQPFSIKNSDTFMPVLMAVAKKQTA